eukprot:3312240-Rhodomonas_salina.3
MQHCSLWWPLQGPDMVMDYALNEITLLIGHSKPTDLEALLQGVLPFPVAPRCSVLTWLIRLSGTGGEESQPAGKVCQGGILHAVPASILSPQTYPVSSTDIGCAASKNLAERIDIPFVMKEVEVWSNAFAIRCPFLTSGMPGGISGLYRQGFRVCSEA